MNQLVSMAAVALSAAVGAADARCPDPGDLVAVQKVSQTTGGFSGMLSDDDRFGAGVASIGDSRGGPPAGVRAQWRPP